MKIAYLLFITILFAECKNHHSNMATDHFISQRFAKTATIKLNGEIENIFPLFGAFEEKKWADGWHPALIYPGSEKITEWLTFKTPGHIQGETENTWIVSRYQPANFFIQYLVLATHRYLTISVSCIKTESNATSAEITYTSTGLDNLGNEIGEHLINKMYARSLKDWEEAINYYLKTGETLKARHLQ
jgi:hypothetical protein